MLTLQSPISVLQIVWWTHGFGVGDGYTDPTVLVQAGIRSSWDPGTNSQVNQAWWWVVGNGLP
ncbi:MAG TPA: hypothetical protein VGL94_01125 [Ktedonobacteraceae bacterium]